VTERSQSGYWHDGDGQPAVSKHGRVSSQRNVTSRDDVRYCKRRIDRVVKFYACVCVCVCVTDRSDHNYVAMCECDTDRSDHNYVAMCECDTERSNHNYVVTYYAVVSSF